MGGAGHTSVPGDSVTLRPQERAGGGDCLWAFRVSPRGSPALASLVPAPRGGPTGRGLTSPPGLRMRVASGLIESQAGVGRPGRAVCPSVHSGRASGHDGFRLGVRAQARPSTALSRHLGRGLGQGWTQLSPSGFLEAWPQATGRHGPVSCRPVPARCSPPGLRRCTL